MKSNQPYIILWDEFDSWGPLSEDRKQLIAPESVSGKRLDSICSSPKRFFISLLTANNRKAGPKKQEPSPQLPEPEDPKVPRVM